MAVGESNKAVLLGSIAKRARKNGKQESFWNGIEGRLLPMLEGVADLSLAKLE
jgi:hypothetical protein